MRENKIERYFVERVNATGGKTRKVQWVGRDGAPDRWVGYPGIYLTAWVELKGDGGKLSVMQQREHDMLRACGEKVCVLWSIEDVNEFIRTMIS